MEKFKKIKFGCIGILTFMLFINFLSVKKTQNRIQEIKKSYLRLKLNNIYLLQNEKLSLAFIKDNKVKEFKDLDNIGEIKKDTPILIFKDEKYGYIDTNGKILIPLKYEAIGIFKDGIALAKKNSKIGVLNTVGKEIIPFKYDEIYIGKNNEFIVKENSQYFFYDSKEKSKLDTDGLQKINDELIMFSKNEKLGIMDYKGNIIIPSNYDEISSFIDKLFIGFIENKYSLFNLENEKITKDYDFIEQIGNNEYRAGSKENGDYAFLSKEFETEEKYEDVYKINQNIFVGTLRNEKVDIFDLKLKTVKSISSKNLNKYIEDIKE